jgi:hypothetical protein
MGKNSDFSSRFLPSKTIIARPTLRFFMKLKSFFGFACLALLCLTSCYQAHSDDDLRTVPATNNPHIIGEAMMEKSTPGMNY